MQARQAHPDRQRIERHTAGEAWRERDLVFCTRNGTPIIPWNLDWHYKRPLRQAGLPDRRCHDLRAEEVKDILGHTSITITVDTYRHWLPRTGERAATAMNAFLAECPRRPAGGA